MNKKTSLLRKCRKSLPAGTAALALAAVVLCFSGTTDAAGGASYVYVVNPGSSTDRTNWRAVIDKEKIYEWGRTRDLYLVSDKGPVIDGRAGYPLEEGSVVTITGLGQKRNYWLWIDFVSFIGKGNGQFFSPLTITISSKGTSTVFEKKIKPQDRDPGSIFFIEIPYELTVSPSMEITLREDAPRYGGWGVWDIIVTDTGNLPEKIGFRADTKKKMEIKPKLLK